MKLHAAGNKDLEKLVTVPSLKTNSKNTVEPLKAQKANWAKKLFHKEQEEAYRYFSQPRSSTNYTTPLNTTCYVKITSGLNHKPIRPLSYIEWKL